MALNMQPFYIEKKDGSRDTIYAPAGSSCKAALDYNGMLLFEVNKIGTGPLG